MRRALIILFSLMIVFSGSWFFKDKTPQHRSDALAANQEVAWWNLMPNQKPVASDDWRIDPEIPDNYVPVPGEDELYMVIDEDGKIKAYRHRTKQQDGSWLWETVNPDIPAGYIPVDGVKDVYKIIDADGTERYVKYIRNDDDTFTFVPCDANGNIIDVQATLNDDGIPSNYVRVKDNIFAVYDDNGVLIGYKERIQNEDGTYSWVDCEAPKQEQEQVGNGGNGSSGNSSSGNGNGGNNGSGGQQSNPVSEHSIPQDPGGQGGTGQVSLPSTNPQNPTSQVSTPEESSKQPVEVSPGIEISTPEKQRENYTTTDTYQTTETAGDWKITYETIVYKTYDPDGVLIATKKVGPNEVKRERLGADSQKAPDRSRIENTLDKELTRVSSGIVYDEKLANEVLNKLNADRTAHGLPTLKMTTSGNAYKIARLLAADMATYNHSDYDSPMYGTLTDLLQRYQITAQSPSEITWKATQKTAQDIHSRLQAQNYNTRMNTNTSEVGIAIANCNGYYYICEIYL